MTGPEHYKNAERLARSADHLVELARSTSDAGNDVGSEAAKWAADHVLAKAQVHATLALAAATMHSVVINGEQANAHEWAEVTS